MMIVLSGFLVGKVVKVVNSLGTEKSRNYLLISPRLKEISLENSTISGSLFKSKLQDKSHVCQLERC